MHRAGVQGGKRKGRGRVLENAQNLTLDTLAPWSLQVSREYNTHRVVPNGLEEVPLHHRDVSRCAS